MRTTIALLLLAAAIAFGLGISLPIVRFEKLYFFEETPSIVGLVSGLWQDGSWALSLAVALFSIVFPLAKMAMTFRSALAPSQAKEIEQSKSFDYMAALAKWSMMDVLLVALVIFAAKTSGLATAAVQPGLWFYATSAISGALAAGMIKRL